MKRAKIIPSLLMLVLCVATLCVGIYAATPTSHSIAGKINITSAGSLIEAQAFLGTTDTELSDPISTRYNGGTLVLNKKEIKFNCADSYEINIDPITIILRIKNKSNSSLGVYFVEPTTNAEGDAIASTTKTTTQYISGIEDTTSNPINDIIRADLPDYTELPAKQDSEYTDLEINLNLLKASDSPMTARIDLFLVIGDYV